MASPSVASRVTTTVTVTGSISATGSSRVTPQGGILEGGNPSHFDASNPIALFIIQAAIIIIFCRLLHYPLSKLRQPRVIAEVIGGILLGPTAMGRIPGFKDAIFPKVSMPPLSLAANLGLVLFLFLVGLEVDLRFLVSNWRIALSVGAVGMALPFGLGCAIAWGLYHQFGDEPGLAPIGFGVFMLFVGVAMAITAFPVLCRILTELKLLNTPVGIIVLSAGVGNDVVGWILLALCVALVNSGTGLTALWVLFTAMGYCLFLAYGVRPVFMKILKRNNSLQNGPSQSIMALTLLMVLASSFFTHAIGIHAIFGAFMIGLICPHEGGFAVKVVEKLEDVITVLLLPLYFALSGLNTNIALLDNGITWAYVIGVISVAFFTKVTGGLLAARANGLLWRESAAIGALMSCKGLVELIVLNIGLQAKILSTRTFTIFVVMALVTTFATTPLTTFLYPESYQKKVDLWKRGKIDWDGNPLHGDEEKRSEDPADASDSSPIRRMLVYLRLDGLPSLFTFINLLGEHSELSKPTEKKHYLLNDDTDGQATAKTTATSLSKQLKRPLEVHGLRLVELTERESSVMQVSEIDEYGPRDPVVRAFRTFGQFSDVAVAGGVAVVPERSYADTLIEKADDLSSDFVLVPWSETGAMSELPSLNPVGSTYQRNGPYLSFLNEIFDRSALHHHVGIFVDKSEPRASEEKNPRLALTRTTTGGISIRSGHRGLARIPKANPLTHHLIVPYLGTLDDQFAVRLALQLARNASITATILSLLPDTQTQNQITAQTSPSVADTEETASTTDHIHDTNKTPDAANAFFANTRDTLPPTLSGRVLFQSTPLPPTATPADLLAQIAQLVAATAHDRSIEPVVICGRSVATNGASLTGDAAGVSASTSHPQASASVPQTPKTANLLNPMASALWAQTPHTPGGNGNGHGIGVAEGRVLGALGGLLVERSQGAEGVGAAVLVVQSRREKNGNGNGGGVGSGSDNEGGNGGGDGKSGVQVGVAKAA